MKLIKIISSRRKRRVAIKKKREREAYIEWLWKENGDFILMFSSTLLIPLKKKVISKTATNVYK